MLLSPLLFFVLNYLAVLTGYDPQPERGVKKPNADMAVSSAFLVEALASNGASSSWLS